MNFSNLRLWLLAAISIFMLSACSTMTREDYSEWETLLEKENNEISAKIATLESDIQETKYKIQAREQQKKYLEEKSRLLEKENNALNKNWRSIRTDAKDTYANIFSQLQECQNIFCDIRLGTVASKKAQNLETGRVTAIIDLSNKITADCLLQTMELYTSKPPIPPARFYLAVFSKCGQEQYVITKVSQPLYIHNQGLNLFNLMSAPLPAREGDYVGLVLTKGCNIDFDELDLALMQDLQLASFQPEGKQIPITVPTPVKSNDGQTPGSKRFAFSVAGTSQTKYVFLFDNRNHIPSDGALKSLNVTFKNIAGNNVERSFYLALFRPGAKGLNYNLVALSKRMSVIESGETQHEIMNSEFYKIYAKSGDICALVISPGIRLRNVEFPSDKFKTAELPFNPIKPNLCITIPNNYDKCETKDDVEYFFDCSVQQE